MPDISLPKTRIDARKLGVNKFFSDIPCIQGHLAPRSTVSGTCDRCQRNAVLRRQKTPKGKAYKAKWHKKNRKRILKQQKKYRDVNKERIKIIKREWYRRNKLRTVIRIKSNTERYKKDGSRKKTLRLYRINNREKRKADLAYYKARKRHATLNVPWMKEQIEIFYLNCPEGYQVDHIVPLRGKKVCGLHTITNLQYLPELINIAKGNKYEQN